MARKKASETNGAAPEPLGDNKPTELTADERKALFFHHFEKISAKKADLEKLREDYKQLRKLAKADGLVMADLDFAMRCAEIEDVSIVAGELKRRTEIAAWFALPVAFQADLFTDFADANERIEKEGEAAGLAGKARDGHGYAKGSPEAELYEHGYDRGQKVMRDNLQAALEKNNAAAAEKEQAKLVKAAEAEEDEGGEGDPFEDDPRPPFLAEKHDLNEPVH